MLAAISPPGVAQGRFVGGHLTGLAGCKPPPIFMRGASSCSSQGRRQGETRGAPPRLSAPTYLPFPAATASSSLCSPGRSNPGTLLPWTFQSRAFTTRMLQCVCIFLPDVPVRVPCACPLLLLLLRLPRPNSCSSCPLSPPFLAPVMFPLPFLAAAAVSSLCSPGRSIPGSFLPRTFQSRASTNRMFQSGCVASPDFPVRVPCFCPLLLLLLLLPLPDSPSSCRPSPFPCSCSCSSRRFSTPPSPPPCVAPDVPIRGFPPPGCASLVALLPRMVRSGFHVLVRLPLPPGCSGPGGPVVSNAPVRGTGFTP